MIVSWNWLKDYVPLEMSVAEVEQRLMMAGLNHEGTDTLSDDVAIDLEVTSNRPDCLGHLGVAREISVLFDLPLQTPAATPQATGPAVGGLASIEIECPHLCYRYTGRVIRGVKVGPSPEWLVSRLRAVGLAVVNNVVDVTNYVLLECGQPLHAFDFSRVDSAQIIVREAHANEEFLAIDHRTYKLEPGMCVIADAARSIALGGVMGGADTEVSNQTTDLLIESAEFAQLGIRTTARKLNLHSPASYRFERGVDPVGVEWASKRCCELLLDLAGGELAEGVVEVGRDVPTRPKVVLRFPQLARILGIEIGRAEVARILQSLGNEITDEDSGKVEVIPPSWRRDLTREIDLVEEVARIHGYEKIPEDVAVPMWPSHRSDSERVAKTIRRVLVAAGFDEAITASLVPREWSESFSPWSDAEPIVSLTPMKGILADAPKDLGQAELIRRSLIPSLLEARRYNESVANPSAELFELGKVYLPREDALPLEQWTLGIVSGVGYQRLRGVIEDLLDAMGSQHTLQSAARQMDLLDTHLSSELTLGNELLGFLGPVASDSLSKFNLRANAVVAELRIATLEESAVLIPQYHQPSPYPAMSRDLNLIVGDRITWAQLARTVNESSGELLESLDYQETYRDSVKDGPNTKRLLFSLTLRSATRTLTNEEADAVRDQVVEACAREFSAKLLA